MKSANQIMHMHDRDLRRAVARMQVEAAWLDLQVVVRLCEEAKEPSPGLVAEREEAAALHRDLKDVYKQVREQTR